MHPLLDIRLHMLAQRHGATYIPLWSDWLFVNEYRTREIMFDTFVRARESKRRSLQNAINDVYATGKDSNEVIERLYDVEYEHSAQPNYGYLAPILTSRGFEILTGLTKGNPSIAEKRVLDVGAGSNEFLRFCNDEFNFDTKNLYGIDPSRESVDIINADGFQGKQGVLTADCFESHSFDLIYLSYFIDYDLDQMGTFTVAKQLLRSGGTIILEGWFPVRQFGLLPSDISNHTYVTRGRSAIEDLELVINAFELDAQVHCVRVVRGERHVYSHYGHSLLPSYSLVFKGQ